MHGGRIATAGGDGDKPHRSEGSPLLPCRPAAPDRRSRRGSGGWRSGTAHQAFMPRTPLDQLEDQFAFIRVASPLLNPPLPAPSAAGLRAAPRDARSVVRGNPAARIAPQTPRTGLLSNLDYIRWLKAGYPWKDHELTAVGGSRATMVLLLGMVLAPPPRRKDHDADASRRTYHADTVVAHSHPRGPGQGATSAPNAA